MGKIVNNGNLITLSQAASLLKVNPETLRRWDRQGMLTAIRLGKGKSLGYRRYRLVDIQEFQIKRQSQLNSPTTKPKLLTPISFENKQQKILGYLEDINVEAASIYAGALKVFQDLENSDHIAQAAHSLRELTNVLFRGEVEVGSNNINNLLQKYKNGSLAPDQFLMEVDTLDDKQESKNVKKIQEYIQKSGLSEEVSLKSAQNWVKIHNWFTTISHHGKKPSEEEFIQYLTLLEDNLLAQLGAFYEAVDEIDQLITKEVPQHDDVARLKSLIKKPAHYQYFFNKINNPKWLSLLKKDSFFNFVNPPEPIELEDGGLRYPFWDELQFLVRISDQLPQDVCELILLTKPTENRIVLVEYIEAMLKMPASISKNLLKKIKKERWFAPRFINMAAHKAGELIVQFVKDKEIEAAFSLTELLLGVEKKEKPDFENRQKNGIRTYDAVSKVDEWEYQQIIEGKIPLLSEIDPVRTITLLKNLLEACIYIERQKEDYEDDYFMFMRRPTIEESSQNWIHEDVKNILITAIRDILDNLSDKNSSMLNQAVSMLSNPKGTYPILRRLQFHGYRKKPNIFKEQIASVLSDRKHFDDDRISHEYELLLHDQFGNLSTANQELILNWIKTGPVEKIKDDRYFEYWQVQKLYWIRDNLPKEWLEKYLLLTKKYKPDPVKHGPVVGTWAGPTSPITGLELDTKSIKEIIDYLAGWSPSGGDFTPSPEGLGRELETIISKKSLEFSSLGILFLDRKLRPIYIYYLISGLRKGCQNGLSVDWDSTLKLLSKITSQESLYNYPSDEGFFYDTGWKGVRKISADFIEDILKKGSSALPFKFRDKVWVILKNLIKDSDPDTELEKKYTEKTLKPSHLAINTVRGKAFHALIMYALWVSRNLNPDEKEGILVPEVKKVLAQYLDKEYEKTHTIRSVYGQFYPNLYYLDKEWTLKKVKEIFLPLEEGLGRSAWRTYLSYAVFWSPAVKAIMSLYEKATATLQKEEDRDEVIDRLAEHLMICYWRGDITLKDKVLINFYKNAPESARAHAVWFLWRSLEESKLTKDSRQWKRLKAFWKDRVAATQSEKESDELSRFADWLSSAPEDIKELHFLIQAIIPHLIRGSDVGYLLEYLKKNLNIDIDLVAESLYQLILKNPEDVKYRLHDQDIEAILTKCIQEGTVKSQELAEKIIHIFGERQNDSFRYLLKKEYHSLI